MHLFADPSAGTLQAAEGGAAGGNLMFLLIAVVFIVLFLVLPARRQKKMRQEMQRKQEAMGPGTPVMTQFGLYGTIASVDRDNATAMLEVSPGTTVKVHLQTVTTILDENGNVPGSPQAAAAGARPEQEVTGHNDAEGTGQQQVRGGTTVNGETVDPEDPRGTDR
ncbi:preprotein translocase subunit YajC [Rothia kristinae]|uniref:Preprotein translocase subunit YajC n=1 Tax=Rothia kristinae TaxID=37923 RepID=A0A199NSW0_9MICC|nr:preprotein translocase subunit YajC [Rothia kristinae]MBG7587406.1 preprotein translocase subunit YajC [Rothia kristinae]MCA1168919.1 preprotein translocase subunit YajC [Rothia kristinae]OAX52007.1 hypothetical protein AN277_0205845 [Rothia kristinae]QPT53366.1 preprotein translocase subunit YajC [Rothia kristinae]SQC28900.1 preprotein translocase subunit YajC [Rothia kristinae]